MRALAVLLLLLTTAAPALAAQPCSSPERSPKTIATPATKGQQQVVVRITVPIESENDVRQTRYAFGIKSLDKTFRYDADQLVARIGSCSKDTVENGMFLTGGITWVRLRGFVARATDTIMTLESPIPMPSAVVAQQPLVFANLRSGSYIGRWTNEQGKVVLVLEERK